MKTNLNNFSNGLNTENASRAYKQVPWNGNLDDAEMQRPGGLLMAALISHANEHRMTLNDMACELGVGYGYINQLRTGIRSIDSIGDDFSHAIARYLEIPRMTVLQLAGCVTPEDCFENRKMMAGEISRAMAYICSDMKWGPFVTPALRCADETSQFGLIKMFEAATGKVLLNNAIDLDSLAERISEFNEIQATRKLAVNAHVAKKAGRVKAPNGSKRIK